jgi:hypothetical protein
MEKEAQVQPYYSCKELLELYQETGSVDAAVLNRAAQEKYPERTDLPEIQVEEGNHGRWFPINAERTAFQAPKYTIKGGYCNWIGVMEDGTAHEF